MRFIDRQTNSSTRRLANTLAAALLACSCAWADTPGVPAAQPAVWTAKDLLFSYQGYTTKYSCSGLQQKMRKLLLKLGARSDLDVKPYGCTTLVGPDPFAGVQVRMHVLQPASAQGAGDVPAHWQEVDLLADRELFNAAADCELIAQLDQKVLPLFATRNVDYSATCARHLPVIGSTRLKAQVLTADETASRSAAR